MGAPMEIDRAGKAEQSRDGKVLLYIVGGGILLGIACESIFALALSTLLTAVVLNGWLLITSAIRIGRWDRIPMAAIGSIPAGLFDSLKIFAIGLITRWLSSFFT